MKTGIKIGFAFCVSIVSAAFVAREIEANYFPVFTQVEYVTIKSSHSHTDMLIRGVKNRSCYLIGASALLKYHGGTVRLSPKMLRDDGEVLEPREQRIATGNRFVRVVRVPHQGEIEQIYITSYCHPLWLTEQELIK